MGCCRKSTTLTQKRVVRGAPWTAGAQRQQQRQPRGDRVKPPKTADKRVPVYEEPGTTWRKR